MTPDVRLFSALFRSLTSRFKRGFSLLVLVLFLVSGPSSPTLAAPPPPVTPTTTPPLTTTTPPPTTTTQEAQLETNHLRFLFPPEWRPLATFLHKGAEDDLQRLARELGGSPSGKMTIRMAFAGPEFAAIQPSSRIPHHTVAGLAYPDRQLITLRILPAEGKERLRQTFLHEISHLLLYQIALQRNLPLWFVEGVAMLQSDDLASFERFISLTQARLFRSIPLPDQLAQRWPRDQAGLALAYAISYDFVSFLRRRDPALLPKLTYALRQGVSFDHAIALVFRSSWPSLVKEWQLHLRQTYSYWALLSSEMFWAFLLLPLMWFSWRKLRRQRREQLDAMEREEALELSIAPKTSEPPVSGVSSVGSKAPIEPSPLFPLHRLNGHLPPSPPTEGEGEEKPKHDV